MEIIDDQKFYQQMERLKQETFWKYLTHSHQFLYFIPLLCLIDFLFYPHFSWWFVLKLLLLVGSMFLYLYWIYNFYRRIDQKGMISFLFLKLFFIYDLCNSVVMMIIMTNFYQTFVKKIGFFYNLIGAVVLGIIVGCVYSGCSYERIKVYLGSKKKVNGQTK